MPDPARWGLFHRFTDPFRSGIDTYRGSQGPLHLLIDSTGIKVEGEGEWNARKHGGPRRRIWRKVHLGIDEETLEIRAVEVTSSNVGDAPMLPELLEQIAPDHEIGIVTADGAYDTRKCRDAIADRDAAAIIPQYSPAARRHLDFVARSGLAISPCGLKGREGVEVRA